MGVHGNRRLPYHKSCRCKLLDGLVASLALESIPAKKLLNSLLIGETELNRARQMARLTGLLDGL